MGWVGRKPGTRAAHGPCMNFFKLTALLASFSLLTACGIDSSTTEETDVLDSSQDELIAKGRFVTFTGRVRGDEGGVAAMTLEHYPGMTEAELGRIEAEAQSRWPLQASLIVHRVGELKPGDNIVLAGARMR